MTTTDGFGHVRRAVDADSRIGASRWVAEGQTVPKTIIDFREETFGRGAEERIVTICQWRAEPKVKIEETA